MKHFKLIDLLIGLLFGDVAIQKIWKEEWFSNIAVGNFLTTLFPSEYFGNYKTR